MYCNVMLVFKQFTFWSASWVRFWTFVVYQAKEFRTSKGILVLKKYGRKRLVSLTAGVSQESI